MFEDVYSQQSKYGRISTKGEKLKMLLLRLGPFLKGKLRVDNCFLSQILSINVSNNGGVVCWVFWGILFWLGFIKFLCSKTDVPFFTAICFSPRNKEMLDLTSLCKQGILYNTNAI